LPPEKPIENEKTFKELKNEIEIKKFKKNALKEEAIAMKKEDLAKQVL
jgi:hypothetical protein